MGEAARDKLIGTIEKIIWTLVRKTLLRLLGVQRAKKYLKELQKIATLQQTGQEVCPEDGLETKSKGMEESSKAPLVRSLPLIVGK
jgi:hypothetical protein